MGSREKCSFAAVLLALIFVSAISVAADDSHPQELVVAPDGSGHYMTVKEALDAASRRTPCRILVKEGVYHENLWVDRDGISLVGVGMDRTIITGNRSNKSGYSTFNSATLTVHANHFLATDLTLENSAGPEAGQAVALLTISNHTVFFRCSIKGYQDALYAKTGIQFYRDCNIYGTVDIIFGDATAIFQNCNIYARHSRQAGANTITAQGRASSASSTGYVFQNCTIAAAPELVPFLASTKTFFGRPWRAYSRVVVMSSDLTGVLDPKGWSEWSDREALRTLYYGEFHNRGIRASTRGRVKWAGFRVIRSRREARKFVVDKFIRGKVWLPATGVPFVGGLM